MQSFTYADLQYLFTFPFRDSQWKNKLLIGGLISLAGFVFPIIPWIFLYGYAAQIMRRIIVENGEPGLPEWGDWNQLFIDGLRLGGVVFIVLMPLILFLLSGYGLMVLPQLFVGFRLADDQALTPTLEILPLLGMVVSWAVFGLGMIGGVTIGVILPAAQGHLIATNQFAAAFRIKEWWQIFRANLAGFIIAYIIMTGATFLVGVAFQILYFTIIFCCFMPFVLSAFTIYQITVWHTLIAQTYRTGVVKLAAHKEALK
jgi:Protein of unknown function (DUF4013)